MLSEGLYRVLLVVGVVTILLLVVPPLVARYRPQVRVTKGPDPRRPLPPYPALDVERLYRAMVNLDTDDPGVFNIIAISEPDTRPVARALAIAYAALDPAALDPKEPS